jgi:hypothetical protein
MSEEEKEIHRKIHTGYVQRADAGEVREAAVGLPVLSSGPPTVGESSLKDLCV